jgi:hypothetical protein
VADSKALQELAPEFLMVSVGELAAVIAKSPITFTLTFYLKGATFT